MDEEIKKILEENLKLTQEIHQMTKEIKNYINFQKVMSLIYILLIVVPIILGIIYLPPLLSNLLEQYRGLLGGADASGVIENPLSGLLQGSPAGLDLNKVDPNSLPPQFRSLLKK